MAKDRREQDRQPVHETFTQERPDHRRRSRCARGVWHRTAAGAECEGNGNLVGNVDVVTVEHGASPRGRRANVALHGGAHVDG